MTWNGPSALRQYLQLHPSIGPSAPSHLLALLHCLVSHCQVMPTLHHLCHLESHLVLPHNKHTLNSNSSTIDILLQLSSSQQYCDHPCYRCDGFLIYQVLITSNPLFDQKTQLCDHPSFSLNIP